MKLWILLKWFSLEELTKDIVSILNKAGGYAFGLTGKDASFIKQKNQISNKK